MLILIQVIDEGRLTVEKPVRGRRKQDRGKKLGKVMGSAKVHKKLCKIKYHHSVIP